MGPLVANCPKDTKVTVTHAETTMTKEKKKGEATIDVASTVGILVGSSIKVGNETYEVDKIEALTLTLKKPLVANCPKDTKVTVTQAETTMTKEKKKGEATIDVASTVGI